jgi:hypothetical protein
MHVLAHCFTISERGGIKLNVVLMMCILHALKSYWPTGSIKVWTETNVLEISLSIIRVDAGNDHKLLMETEHISEMLMQLISQEGFIVYVRHESFKSYRSTVLGFMTNT